MIASTDETEETDGEPDLRLAVLFRCLEIVPASDRETIREMIEDLKSREQEPPEVMQAFELCLGGARGPARADGRRGDVIYQATLPESIRPHLRDFISSPAITQKYPQVTAYLGGAEVFRTVGTSLQRSLTEVAQGGEQLREAEARLGQVEVEVRTLQQQVIETRQAREYEQQRLREIREDVQHERGLAADERKRIRDRIEQEQAIFDRQAAAFAAQLTAQNQLVNDHRAHIQAQIAQINEAYRLHCAEVQELKKQRWEDAGVAQAQSRKQINGASEFADRLAHELAKRTEHAATGESHESSQGNSFLDSLVQHVVGPVVGKMTDAVVAQPDLKAGLMGLGLIKPAT